MRRWPLAISATFPYLPLTPDIVDATSGWCRKGLARRAVDASGGTLELDLADIERVTGIAKDEAQALGFDLVRVRLFGARPAKGDDDGDDRTLQIMAERASTRQLTIDDCGTLSRAISERLDALEEAGDDPIPGSYRLEVSSPGSSAALSAPPISSSAPEASSGRVAAIRRSVKSSLALATFSMAKRTAPPLRSVKAMVPSSTPSIIP